jgi:polyisoprenyl-phosphate glycosyltransferase
MFVSVVVPCYNEEEVLATTHRELVTTLEQLDGRSFEIIYVDDGSTDATPVVLDELVKSDSRARVVRLSRNFGHQAALTAGLSHASGDAIVVIDADLQDPPTTILEMVALWQEGYDVVYGVRTEREGETRFKLWTAKAFYRMVNRLSRLHVPPDAGDFRLMDRRVVQALLEMPERDRFLRGMITWVGFRQVALMYARASRRAGTSKYPLLKMIRFAIDALLSFSFTPLRIAIWLGLVSIGASFAGIVYALVVRLYTTDWVRGWASIFIAVLFLGGIQLVTLGIVGEYIGRIYAEVKRRPLYFVQEVHGFEEDAGYEAKDRSKAAGSVRSM